MAEHIVGLKGQALFVWGLTHAYGRGGGRRILSLP